MEGPSEERIRTLIRDRFGSEASVVRLQALPGDASTRSYVRAHIAGAAAPPSVIVMLLADRGVAMSSDELAVFTHPPAELPYVNVHRFLAALGVAVPELYADASEQGMLLLEDVGDTPLWDAVAGRTPQQVRALFRQAIDQLLLIQLRGTERRDESCIAFQQSFDERLFDWEFEHFLEYGLPPYGVPLSHGETATLRSHFAAISRFLAAQPRYLNHRDFHAWNLFVHDGAVRVIDFQDALLAPAPYDLATLLGDRDTPSVIGSELERELLGDYAAGWQAAGGPPWRPGELWDVYATCALQKAFKVVGRFHYLDRVKGKPGYLRYLPPTLRQIARLLAQRPDLKEVRAILARRLPELTE
jgi:N-acetylmuramate 1-kinase